MSQAWAPGYAVVLVVLTAMVVVAATTAIGNPALDRQPAVQSGPDGPSPGERLTSATTNGSSHTPGGGWPMSRANAANTNHINSTGPTNPITVRWTFETDANNIRAGPVVVNGTVYFGTTNSSNGIKLFAVDAWTGEQRWAGKTPRGGTPNHIAVFRNTVYVGSGGWVYALDAATGDIFWEFSPEGKVKYLTVADRSLYVASTGSAPGLNVPDGRVYALGALRGEEKWTFTTDGPTTGLAVKDDTTYVTARYGNVYALDAETGKPRWDVVVKDGKWLHPPSVANNTVYVGSLHLNARPSDHGYLFALDPKTGEERWQRSKRGKTIRSPSVLGDTAYYSGKYLHAVNAQTGDDRWSKRSLKGTPVLLNDIGYVRTNKTLHTLDPETGAHNARWTPAQINSSWDKFHSPMAVYNGSLYTGVGYDDQSNRVRFDRTIFYALGTPEFTYSNLSVTPRNVDPGEPVTATVTVTNTGTGPGAFNATLAVDGDVVNATTGRLDAGASRTVTFTYVFEEDGAYTVGINGRTRNIGVGAATPAPSPTPTPTPTATKTSTGGEETRPATVTPESTPGFGVSVGVAAVALVAGLVGLRKRP